MTTQDLIHQLQTMRSLFLMAADDTLEVITALENGLEVDIGEHIDKLKQSFKDF